MKKFFTLMFALFIFTITLNTANAAGWYWLSSDSKYTKEFDPTSVVVTKKKNVDGKEVPTEIMVWTKTSYSYQGAAETIKTYNIGHLIKDPNTLSYSLAQVVINPQDRTVYYKQEVFYDKQGNPLYTRNNSRVKEINSQQFDEAFYDSAVDEVFRMGEMARAKAKDRWITLWTAPVKDETVTVTADTTTFRMRGNNLIFWEWEEHKNLSNQVVEIRFQKKRINVETGAEQLIEGKVWTSKAGWQNVSDPYEGRFHKVEATSPAIKGIERLQAYAKGYSTWVHRYSTESVPKPPTASAINTQPNTSSNASNATSNNNTNNSANNNANNNTNAQTNSKPVKSGGDAANKTTKPVLSSNKGVQDANKNTK